MWPTDGWTEGSNQREGGRAAGFRGQTDKGRHTKWPRRVENTEKKPRDEPSEGRRERDEGEERGIEGADGGVGGIGLSHRH